MARGSPFLLGLDRHSKQAGDEGDGVCGAMEQKSGLKSIVPLKAPVKAISSCRRGTRTRSKEGEHLFCLSRQSA
jgi:hypothetical protein